MTTPRVLLFDLGGVLVHNTGPERLAALVPASARGVDVTAKWLSSRVVREFELGNLQPTEFARQLVDEWKLLLSPDELLAEFVTWPKGFYPGAEDLLQQLRDNFRLACLSNSNSLHWPRLKPLLTNFDLALSSHELGWVKPDAECFAAALERLEVAALEVAFFDDSPANVAAASAQGMRAFRVTDANEVKSTLQSEGWIH